MCLPIFACREKQKDKHHNFYKQTAPLSPLLFSGQLTIKIEFLSLALPTPLKDILFPYIPFFRAPLTPTVF